ncbi:MAG: hypothetical protein Q9159_002873 [Coniocarpon cinnabarinum]
MTQQGLDVPRRSLGIIAMVSEVEVSAGTALLTRLLGHARVRAIIGTVEQEVTPAEGKASQVTTFPMDILRALKQMGPYVKAGLQAMYRRRNIGGFPARAAVYTDSNTITRCLQNEAIRIHAIPRIFVAHPPDADPVIQDEFEWIMLDAQDGGNSWLRNHGFPEVIFWPSKSHVGGKLTDENFAPRWIWRGPGNGKYWRMEYILPIAGCPDPYEGFQVIMPQVLLPCEMLTTSERAALEKEPIAWLAGLKAIAQAKTARKDFNGQAGSNDANLPNWEDSSSAIDCMEASSSRGSGHSYSAIAVDGDEAQFGDRSDHSLHSSQSNDSVNSASHISGSRNSLDRHSSHDFISSNVHFSTTNHYHYHGYPPVSGPSYRCPHDTCQAPPFHTANELNEHQKSHYSDRPHLCPRKECPRSQTGREFKSREDVLQHVDAHDGFVCPFCRTEKGYRYSHARELALHVRAFHEEVETDDSRFIDAIENCRASSINYKFTPPESQRRSYDAPHPRRWRSEGSAPPRSEVSGQVHAGVEPPLLPTSQPTSSLSAKEKAASSASKASGAQTKISHTSVELMQSQTNTSIDVRKGRGLASDGERRLASFIARIQARLARQKREEEEEEETAKNQIDTLTGILTAQNNSFRQDNAKLVVERDFYRQERDELVAALSNIRPGTTMLPRPISPRSHQAHIDTYHEAAW